MNISGPAGFGKSMGALKTAFGLCGDWTKIAVIDTENGSADLYAHLGPYNVLPISAPFTSEKYIAAMKECEKAGMEVIIADSITHVWKGQGGLLEFQNNLGGRYQDWAKTTPLYLKWLNTILQSPCHVITTCRKKQAYNMITEGNKTKVEKAGLEDEIRDGYEYEMTLAFDIVSDKHLAKPVKDRTQMFMGKPEFVLSEETGRMIAEWCEEGIDANMEITEAIDKLKNCGNMDEFRMFGDTLPYYVLNDENFRSAAKLRMNEINPPKTPVANTTP